MGKIKLLSPETYNQIAAGEVVERPFGAVKELVENSIDAGATRIVVEICNGGLDLISVTDNGSGIHEEDIDLAFVKHATSKIENASNLLAIETLGFRGEALSSIAAVSKVNLTTRTRSSDTAVNVTVEAGVVSNKQYVSSNIGTKIEVRDLFYNMPARKKFINNPSSEGAEVTKFVSKLILTNPTLEIKYVVDGKTIYSTNGNGQEEALFTVYGADCVANCIPINYVYDEIRIEGYIANASYTKANRNYQTLAVNHRCVYDQSITSSIMQAYKPYLMTRRFPVYVLDILIPSDLVDVNVHPKKSEVRFASPKKVCGAAYYCVKNALLDDTEQRSREIFSQTDAPASPRYTQEDFIAVFNRMEAEGRLEKMNRDQTAAVDAVEQSTLDADRKKGIEELGAYLEKELTVEKARVNLGLDDPAEVKQPAIVLEASTAESIPLPTEEDLLFDKAKILGVAFKTYLILEIDDKVIFVDQHAAHERILFDKFMAEKTHDMQSVMFPYVFTVNDEEALFLDENRENILAAGIELENFGRNTYRITAVSTVLSDLQMEEFVHFLLSATEEFKLDDRTLLVEALAKKACKAAVKAGYTLNEYEIKYILKEVCDNRILQCPHGRPITVVFTKAQLEKMFKRIV